MELSVQQKNGNPHKLQHFVIILIFCNWIPNDFDIANLFRVAKYLEMEISYVATPGDLDSELNSEFNGI